MLGGVGFTGEKVFTCEDNFVEVNFNEDATLSVTFKFATTLLKQLALVKV